VVALARADANERCPPAKEEEREGGNCDVWNNDPVFLISRTGERKIDLEECRVAT